MGYQYQREQIQTGLPYPAYDGMSWVPQPILPFNPYIHSSWSLPYPPPNFKIIVQSNPISFPGELTGQITVEESTGNNPQLLTVEDDDDDILLAENEMEKVESPTEDSSGVPESNSIKELKKVTNCNETEVAVKEKDVDFPNGNDGDIQSNSNCGLEVEFQPLEEESTEDEILFGEDCIDTEKIHEEEPGVENIKQSDAIAQNVQSNTASEVVDVASESFSQDNPGNFRELVSIVENFGKKMQNESSKDQEKVVQSTPVNEVNEEFEENPSVK